MMALPRVPLSLACYGSSDCCRCRRAARMHAVQVRDYFNRYGFTMPNAEHCALQTTHALSFCHGGCKYSSDTMHNLQVMLLLSIGDLAQDAPKSSITSTAFGAEAPIARTI